MIVSSIRWCGRRFHLAENGEAAGRGLGLPCHAATAAIKNAIRKTSSGLDYGSRQGLDSVLQQ